MKFRVVIHKEEANPEECKEQGYWAEVPALGGCFTRAETIEGIKENIIKAIELWNDTTFGDDEESEDVCGVITVEL